jgi:hypothetical protein
VIPNIYLISKKSLRGQNLLCSYCKQKWFQYYLYDFEQTEVKEINNLKKMALQEYTISKNINTQTTGQLNKEKNEKTLIRLDTVSERFKSSDQQLLNAPENESSNAILVDHSAAIGFAAVSVIFISLSMIYTYNNQIQKLLPQTISFLSEYERIVNNSMVSIKDLIYFSEQLIR